MIHDSTRSAEPGLRSATTANGIAKTGLPTNADQLDVLLHLALTETRNDFRRASARIAEWELTNES